MPDWPIAWDLPRSRDLAVSPGARRHGHNRTESAGAVPAQAHHRQNTVPQRTESPRAIHHERLGRRSRFQARHEQRKLRLLPPEQDVGKVFPRLTLRVGLDQQSAGDPSGAKEIRRRKILRKHHPTIVEAAGRCIGRRRLPTRIQEKRRRCIVGQIASGQDARAGRQPCQDRIVVDKRDGPDARRLRTSRAIEQWHRPKSLFHQGKARPHRLRGWQVQHDGHRLIRAQVHPE